jgi:hypothetical protein
LATFAANREDWRQVALVCRRAGLVGLDTETYGHDVEESTSPHRARVHVWSLAVLTDELHPRGHRVAGGVVLPAAALIDARIRELLEDPAVTKVAWNAPHDVHALRNHAIEVRGWVDGLPRARVQWPGFPRHGLKTVSPLVIGRELRNYEEVLSMDVVEYVDGIACSCQGVTVGQVFELAPCSRRGRKGHERVGVRRPVVRRRLQPLESVNPGHALWEGLLDYAEEDAVAALECWDNMEREEVVETPCPAWRVA